MAKKRASSPKAKSLGEAKLLSSGIDVTQVKELGLEFLDPVETVKHHKAFKPLCSLKINYHGCDGEPLSGWPKSPPFYRLRYLETPTDFQSLTKEKPVRYVQPPATAPVAYYPLNCDFTTIVKDPDQPLVITEGELKAIKACQEGFATIGLGGVYNWRSHKLGLEWLPSLEPVNWVRRNVYICFDSDYKTNFMVCMALKEFAEELHRRGAFAHLVTLPAVPGVEKTGLDDYLISNSAESFRKLLHEAEPLGLTRVLFNFNDRFVYARDPGLIIDQETHQKLAPPAFRDHAQSTARYQEREIERDGSVSHKAVPAAAAWLKWPLRHEVSKLTYAPGKPPLHDDVFNTWRGWGVEPVKGDVKPFLQLVDHIFTGADPGAKEWFLRWCAYPLQYPGTKMYSAVLIHGRRHGTGKSFIGYTLGKIYGENFAEIDQQDVQDNNNDWAENKQFVLADDVTGTNKRHDADILKKKITQRSIRINVKYVPRYSIPDCINWYFTANQPDAFFLEDDDRRNFIQEVTVGPMPDEFYKDYELWLDTGGAEAVFHYLLKLDLGDFNPSGHAFITTAKQRMTSIVQSDLASWVRELMSNPDHVLKSGSLQSPYDLFTSRQLLEIYDPLGKTGTTANGMSRELARAGVQQVAKGFPLRLTDGSQARYYAVRNSDRWLHCDSKECVNHLSAPQQVKKKKY